MNDQTTSTTPIPAVPEQPVQPVPPSPVPPVVPQKTPTILQKMMPVFIVIGAVFFGAFVYYLVQRFTTKEEPQNPITVIVTPTANPTPFRYATAVSTTSAFISLELSISSFSSELAEFSKDDPALSPPNLVLPLGL